MNRAGWAQSEVEHIAASTNSQDVLSCFRNHAQVTEPGWKFALRLEGILSVMIRLCVDVTGLKDAQRAGKTLFLDVCVSVCVTVSERC